ncbi:MAG TPA: alpha-2-macroglobulin, partial [Planctomycetota bacterium]|nr:alpha-2-macroglobulin [Planctomycetota bacterium]
HALASVRGSTKEGGDELIGKAFENLWTRREQLNAYTRALFALAAHHLGLTEKAKTLVRNLENGVKVDLAPDKSVLLQASSSQPEVLGTAHWGEDGIYWRWSEGGVEATAFALRAIIAIDPQNKLVEQVTNWLVKNRRGAQWSNTRDTAIVVLALNDYLKKSGELEPNAEYDVILNGATVVSKKVTPADALNAPSRFTVDAKLLRETTNEVRIVRKNGKSPLYFSVEAVFFSLEEPVAAAGNEIFVKREYQKLAARPTLLSGIVHERAPLGDGGTVKSGERVEVTLTIDAKNHYEYLVFEDLKPAGLEAVEIRSGAPLYARELKESAVERGATESSAPRGAAGEGAPIGSALEVSNYTGRTRWVYQELRDRKVALFLDKLPEGIWEIRYELRAEVPGRFHALPVLGHAMYVPEIRANGAETRIEVEDPKPDVAQRIRRAMVGAD